jgi:hypothetical protein
MDNLTDASLIHVGVENRYEEQSINPLLKGKGGTSYSFGINTYLLIEEDKFTSF